MRRVSILAALLLSAVIGISTWLAIVAQSDPEPLPIAEHLPRDDDQSQQGESQAEPESVPEQEGEEQESADQQEMQGSQAQEIAEDEPQEIEQPEPTEAEDVAAGDDAYQRSPTSYVRYQDLSLFRVITAIDLDRRRFGDADQLTLQYTVKDGDTLRGIAEKHGVDLPALAASNGLESADHLSIGAVLQIPSRYTYVPQEVPPGPLPYEGGELAWGTITDLRTGATHTAVVAWPLKSIAGEFADWSLIIGCINNRLIVELKEDLFAHDSALSDSADVRVYWRVDQGPLRTSRWTRTADVLSSPNPGPLIDSLRGANGLWLWPVIEDHVLLDFWLSEVNRIVATPVQPNIDHCGR